MAIMSCPVAIYSVMLSRKLYAFTVAFWVVWKLEIFGYMATVCIIRSYKVRDNAQCFSVLRVKSPAYESSRKKCKNVTFSVLRFVWIFRVLKGDSFRLSTRVCASKEPGERDFAASIPRASSRTSTSTHKDAKQQICRVWCMQRACIHELFFVSPTSKWIPETSSCFRNMTLLKPSFGVMSPRKSCTQVPYTAKIIYNEFTTNNKDI